MTTTEITTTTLSSGEAAAVSAVIGMLFLFLALVGYIVSSLCLMHIFKKASVPGWMAWVPFVNTWKTLEIGGQQGFWAILAIIPVVSIVSMIMLYIAMHNIGLKLGKGGAFVLLAIFIPIVWMIWLAVDKSRWNDAAAAPSLHRADTPAAPTETQAYEAPAATLEAEGQNNNQPTPPTL